MQFFHFFERTYASDNIPYDFHENDLPNGWVLCRVIDLYNFIDYRGATPVKTTSGIPFVTAKNVKDGYNDYSISEFISEESYEKRKNRGISRKGDILFTTEAPLGNVSLADLAEFSAGQRLKDPHDEPASVLLDRIRAERERMIRGGKIKRGKDESVIFRRDNSHYEIRDGIERCIDDEIPFDIPDNWAWTRLGSIGQTNIGLTYNPSDVTTGKGIAVLRSNNIQDGKICYDNLLYVNLEVSDKLMAQQGDILICARNGSRALVGKSAIIDKNGMTFGAFMAIYRSIFNPYIQVFINSSLFRGQLEGANTTTINQVTQDMLKQSLCPLPPFAEQRRIIERIGQLLSVAEIL